MSRPGTVPANEEKMLRYQKKRMGTRTALEIKGFKVGFPPETLMEELNKIGECYDPDIVLDCACHRLFFFAPDESGLKRGEEIVIEAMNLPPHWTVLKRDDYNGTLWFSAPSLEEAKEFCSLFQHKDVNPTPRGNFRVDVGINPIHRSARLDRIEAGLKVQAGDCTGQEER